MRASFLHRSGRTCKRLCRAAFATAAFTVLPTWAAAEEQVTSSVTEPVLDIAQTTSLALTIMKVLGALLLTVGLMLLLAVWLRKLGLSRAGVQQGRLISIIDTKMIAPKKYVAVVQVANETLALGVTDQQITMLTRLEPGAIPSNANLAENPQQTSFSSLLGKVIKRNGQ